jgi:hypothetical protein
VFFNVFLLPEFRSGTGFAPKIHQKPLSKLLTLRVYNWIRNLPLPLQFPKSSRLGQPPIHIYMGTPQLQDSSTCLCEKIGLYWCSLNATDCGAGKCQHKVISDFRTLVDDRELHLVPFSCWHIHSIYEKCCNRSAFALRSEQLMSFLWHSLFRHFPTFQAPSLGLREPSCYNLVSNLWKVLDMISFNSVQSWPPED